MREGNDLPGLEGVFGRWRYVDLHRRNPTDVLIVTALTYLPLHNCHASRLAKYIIIVSILNIISTITIGRRLTPSARI